MDCLGRNLIKILSGALTEVASTVTTTVERTMRTRKRPRTESLRVEPTDCNDFGPCPCCGNNSRCVWGFIHSEHETIASYFVHWTLGRVPDHGANFDLILGKWGQGSAAQDRCLVALAYRLSADGPSFMVIDAHNRPSATSELVGHVLQRDEVVGQPIAQQAFAVVDAVLAQDVRVAEVLGNRRMVEPILIRRK